MFELNSLLTAITKSEAVMKQTRDTLGASVPDLSYQFWTRMLDGCKAALHLVERGFFTDALALQRLSIENFAFAVSMLTGKLTLAKLEEDAYAELMSHAQKLNERDKPCGALTQENKAQLDKLLSDLEQRGAKPQGINVHNELGRELNFLHGKYRELSLRAAHANLRSAISQQTPSELREMLAMMNDLLNLINAYALNEVKLRAAVDNASA